MMKEIMNYVKPMNALKLRYHLKRPSIVMPTPLSSNPTIALTSCVMQAHGDRDRSTFCQVGAYSPTWRVSADPKYTMVVTTAAVRASVKKLWRSIMKPKID